MNTFRDITRRVERLTPPGFDIDALVALGERSRRRHRTTMMVVAVAVLVIVLAVGGVLINAKRPKATGPIDHPPHPDQTSKPVTRKIVYSDTGLFEHKTGRIHFGDRAVETHDGFVHMDVTDDGVIYTSRGRAWFSDGGTPVQIGSHVCGASRSGVFSNFAHRSVMSANAGSLAAWFDCTDVARPTLVVYDTASRSEVARSTIGLCRQSCELVDVTADLVYLNRGVYAGYPKPEYTFSVRTHQLRATSPQLYARDITAHPRALVIGDTRESGLPTNGTGQVFVTAGSRLVPLGSQNGEKTKAFDTATGVAVQLRLPEGYHGDPDEDFVLFEWLDDDTVALAAGGGGNGIGDILTCRLSANRCDVTVTRAHGENGKEAPRRIVPQLPLPG